MKDFKNLLEINGLTFLLIAEKQFSLISARRSTLTSTNNQKILANVVQPKQTNFASTVKKKRVALMCLGGLGKKKKDKIPEEPSERISGTIKYKGNKKGSVIGDVVSQVMKSKKQKEVKEDKFSKDQRNEDDDDSDDESIEQMRRELACISQGDSAQVINIKSEKSRKSSLIQDKKQSTGGGRVSKWKKVCNKLNK